MEDGGESWLQSKKKKEKKDPPAKKRQRAPVKPKPAASTHLSKTTVTGWKPLKKDDKLQAILVSTDHFTPPAIRTKFTRHADPPVKVVRKQTTIGDFYKKEPVMVPTTIPDSLESNDTFLNLRSPVKVIEITDDYLSAAENDRDNENENGRHHDFEETPPEQHLVVQRRHTAHITAPPTSPHTVVARVPPPVVQISDSEGDSPVKSHFTRNAMSDADHTGGHSDPDNALFAKYNGNKEQGVSREQYDKRKSPNNHSISSDTDQGSPVEDDFVAASSSYHYYGVSVTAVAQTAASLLGGFSRIIPGESIIVDMDTQSQAMFGDDFDDKNEHDDLGNEVSEDENGNVTHDEPGGDRDQFHPARSSFVPTQDASLSYDVEAVVSAHLNKKEAVTSTTTSSSSLSRTSTTSAAKQQKHWKDDDDEDEETEAPTSPSPQKISVHAIPVITFPRLSQDAPSQPAVAPLSQQQLSQQSASSQEYQSPEVVPRTTRHLHSKANRGEKRTHSEVAESNYGDKGDRMVLELPNKRALTGHSTQGEEFVRVAETPMRSSQDFPRFVGPTLPPANDQEVLVADTQFCPKEKRRKVNAGLKRKVVQLETQGDASLFAFSFPQPPGWESSGEDSDDHEKGAYNASDDDETMDHRQIDEDQTVDD